LFTTEWKRFDWFGWGDWLYLITSVLAWAQTFFMFNSSITDDDGDAYYLVGEFCFYIMTKFLNQNIHLMLGSFYSNILVNIFFLLDSLAYFIGYLDFVLSLRQVLLTGTIPESYTSVIS
jgi:hypothetical protein